MTLRSLKCQREVFPQHDATTPICHHWDGVLPFAVFYVSALFLGFCDATSFLLLQIFKEREEDLKRLSRPLACTCFRTSIWDETLYKVS